MSSSPRLVIASNRLPFTVDRADTGVGLVPACGGLAAALTSVHARPGNVWVGWPGDCSDLDQQQRAELWSALRARRVVPVELTPPELVAYYDGICNSVLWPVLHYLIDRIPVTLPDFRHTVRSTSGLPKGWSPHTATGTRSGSTTTISCSRRRWSGRSCRMRGSGSFFTPHFLRRTCFGSSPGAVNSRWRPWRFTDRLPDQRGCRELRRGGSHAHRACRARCVVRRRCSHRAFRHLPNRHRPGTLSIRRAHRWYPGFIRRPSSIRADRQLLVGVDRLDYTKGIDRRLAAFERLLDQHPDLHGTVEMFQLAVPSRDVVPSYVDYRQEVQACVERINRRFETPDWTPVRYVLGSLAPAQLRELYCDADVMLVTSLRDGMNLVAKEFVSCRTDDDGVLVLSEFAGASEELRGALIVNPYSVEHLADAIHTALTMGRDDRRERMLSLRAQVATRTVHQWVDAFMADLASAPLPSESATDLPLTKILRTAIDGAQRLSLASSMKRR